MSANPYRALPKSHIEKEMEEEEKDSSYNLASSNKEIKVTFIMRVESK